MKRLTILAVGVVALAVVAVSAFAVGFAAKQTPKPKPMFPTYAQVTASASVLVHWLENDYHLSLAQAPDFIECDRTRHAGVRCVFQVTFSDDTTDYYGIWLNRANDPTMGKRLKGLPTPQKA